MFRGKSKIPSEQAAGAQTRSPGEAGGNVLSGDRATSAAGQPWGLQVYQHSKPRCSLHRSQYLAQALKAALSPCVLA